MLHLCLFVCLCVLVSLSFIPYGSILASLGARKNINQSIYILLNIEKRLMWSPYRSSLKSHVMKNCIYYMQAIKDAGINVPAFITVGVSAALRQLLEFGLFHGDPHPGNIFAMRDGRIAYVDFGNVAVLSQVSS